MNGQFWAEKFLEVHNYFLLAVIAVIIILFCLSWYYLAYFFNSLKRDKILPRGKNKYKYAILVPARNEDKVIGNLLESLKNQSYPKELFDVYVIVESKLDPTVKITKKYGYNIFIRKDLMNKRTKGHALNEVYQEIRKKGLNYDAFFVFDADNIVSKHYLTLMNDCRNQGYKVAMGYRNFTNSNANWVSACSATLFAFMNQFTSKGRSKIFNKIILTGTGYYVDKDIIDNIGAWIFDGMTEDVELTCYCYYHNISMYYYPIAQYYDEQPTSMKTVHKQHIRWVWGFFENRKRYKTKDYDYKNLTKGKYKTSLFEYNVSIYPLIVIVVLLLLSFLFAFGFFIASLIMMIYFKEFIDQAIPLQMGYYAIVYFLLLDTPFIVASMVTFIISNVYLKFNFKTRFKVYLSFILFFSDFISAFFDGLIHKYKRTTWDKIAHEGKISSKGALKGLENDTKNKEEK